MLEKNEKKLEKASKTNLSVANGLLNKSVTKLELHRHTVGIQKNARKEKANKSENASKEKSRKIKNMTKANLLNDR